ncbi:hypothetical protein C8J57DRAFT_1248026 [Mycena rebaudengoi]|nr:hypothetical protein C8J57DRAFT_1248026 [Mycena rebaudengoi]
MVGDQIWVKHVQWVRSDVLEHVVPRSHQPHYGQGSSHVPVVNPGATLGVVESKLWRLVHVGAPQCQAIGRLLDILDLDATPSRLNVSNTYSDAAQNTYELTSGSVLRACGWKPGTFQNKGSGRDPEWRDVSGRHLGAWGNNDEQEEAQEREDADDAWERWGCAPRRAHRVGMKKTRDQEIMATMISGVENGGKWYMCLKIGARFLGNTTFLTPNNVIFGWDCTEIGNNYCLLVYGTEHWRMHHGGCPNDDVHVDMGGGSGVAAGEETIVSTDRGIYFSADSLRRQEELLNVSHKKCRIQPSHLEDSYGLWIPVPEWGGEDAADQNLDDHGQGEDGGEEPLSSANKRKHYESSDRPMDQWRVDTVWQLFHDELTIHDGVGLHDTAPPDWDTPQVACDLCAAEYVAGTQGPDLLQEWNSEFLETSVLHKLDFVYQFSHGAGPCMFPDRTIRTMTVVDLPQVHKVQFRYCSCQKSDRISTVQQLLRNGWYPATATDPGTCTTFTSLEFFRLLNVVGNVNVMDFMTSVERATNERGVQEWVEYQFQSRTKEWGQMSRQWVFCSHTKRAGRAHLPSGLKGMGQRECMVKCCACPHDGRNLPPDWSTVAPRYQFLYMLLLALDANFKLKNRLRPNALSGGYFVEPERYRKHIKNYVPEKDISTCIAFAALLQKDMRVTMGLRVSGVGGCVCVRHELVLGNGLSHLQKGERLQPHHKDSFQNVNSLSFKPRVGKSDGEGVERVWAILNPAAFHMKVQGIGNQEDMLEDKIDNNNLLKNLGQGEALQPKLVIVIAEQAWQVDAFKEVNVTVEVEALKRDEEAEVVGGRAPLHGTSATVFMTAGLQIEESQPTDDTLKKAQDLPEPPANIHARSSTHNGKGGGEARPGRCPPRVEQIKLWLPSELSEEDHVHGCMQGVVKIKRQLRIVQCLNSLVNIRSCLHVKRHLISFRNANVTGQIQSTKAWTLIGQVSNCIDASAAKYCVAHATLVVLGVELGNDVQELLEKDVGLPGDKETDTKAIEKLAAVTAEWGARTSRNVPGELTRVMSWIWTSQGARPEGESKFTIADWWRKRERARPEALKVHDGMRAYALKQAALHVCLVVHFWSHWDEPARDAARRVLVPVPLDLEGADLDQFFASHD